MKKQLSLWMTFAFVFSFLCACSAYTPGPSTSRSSAAPISVPTTAMPETTIATTAAPPTTEEYSTWAEVTHESTEETEPPKEYMVVLKGVNVRQEPNKNATILGTLSRGETIERTGQEGSWVQVVYNGETAYVYQDYLAPSEPGDSEDNEEE